MVQTAHEAFVYIERGKGQQIFLSTKQIGGPVGYKLSAFVHFGDHGPQ